MTDLFDQICGIVDNYNRDIIRNHKAEKTSKHIETTFKEDKDND